MVKGNVNSIRRTPLNFSKVMVAVELVFVGDVVFGVQNCSTQRSVTGRVAELELVANAAPKTAKDRIISSARA